MFAPKCLGSSNTGFSNQRHSCSCNRSAGQPLSLCPQDLPDVKKSSWVQLCCNMCCATTFAQVLQAGQSTVLSHNLAGHGKQRRLLLGLLDQHCYMGLPAPRSSQILHIATVKTLPVVLECTGRQGICNVGIRDLLQAD